MNIRPMGNRVLVRRLESKAVTDSGLIIPEKAQEKPQTGKVVAVGSGTVNSNGERQSLTVAAGDIVLFGKYAGTDITVDGENLLLIKDEDILAIVE